MLIYFGNSLLINSALSVHQHKMGRLNCFNVGNRFLNHLSWTYLPLVSMKLYIISSSSNVMLICIKTCTSILMSSYMYQVAQHVSWYGWPYAERYHDSSSHGNNDLDFCEHFVWIRWSVFASLSLFQHSLSNTSKPVQLLLIRNVVV